MTDQARPDLRLTTAGVTSVMLIAAWLLQTSTYFGGYATGPVAPFIQDDLHISRAEVGLFVSAFSAGSTLTLLPAGWLADRFGVRLLLAGGPGIVGLLLIAASRTTSFWSMVAAMLIAGLGAGIAGPAATKAVMDWFSARTRGTAMGFKQTGTSLGSAIAAALLPTIALASGWRDAIAICGFTNVAVCIACYLSYRDPPAATSAAVHKPLSSLWTVLANPNVRLVCATGLCFTATQLTVITYLVLYLKEVLAMPVTFAGGLLAMAQMSGVAGRMVLGLASDRLFGGSRRQMLVLTGVGSVAGVIALALAGAGLPPWLLTVVLLVFGFTGMGYTGLLMTMTSELSGRALTGVSSAVALFACNIGILVGPPLFGLLVDRSQSYSLGWAAMALIAIVGTVLLFPVRERLLQDG